MGMDIEQQHIAPDGRTSDGQTGGQSDGKSIGTPNGPANDGDKRYIPLRERVMNVLQRLRLRRREPWNWLVQTASLALLMPGLLFHSAALIVLALLGLLAGCLKLALPPMAFTGFRRLLPYIERCIGLENAWLARPLDAKKQRQILLCIAGGAATLLLLWLQDLGPIGVGITVLALLHVRRKNIEQGIDP